MIFPEQPREATGGGSDFLTSIAIATSCFDLVPIRYLPPSILRIYVETLKMDIVINSFLQDSSSTVEHIHHIIIRFRKTR